MSSDASVKAPGKILWIGGYSVLERPNISFVSAVNAYVTAKLNIKESAEIELSAPQLKMVVKGSLDAKIGRIETSVPKEMLLFKTAAEVALRYVIGLGLPVSGFKITTKNDTQFAYSLSTGKVVKSGLGSSAAVTTATVGVVLKAFGANASKNDALHKLAQIAHSLATGKVGSGFDIAAASFGSIFYTRYSPEILKSLSVNYTNAQLLELVEREWDYKIEKFALPSKMKLLFANFGEAMITTKAIGSVSDFKKKEPKLYEKLIGEINGENLKAIEALKGIKNGNAGMVPVFKDAFNKGRLLTKKLGELSGVEIEPDDCTELMKQSEKEGAFVIKLPGAGGKDAIAALSLTSQDKAKLKAFWESRKELNISSLKLVEKGLI